MLFAGNHLEYPSVEFEGSVGKGVLDRDGFDELVLVKGAIGTEVLLTDSREEVNGNVRGGERVQGQSQAPVGRHTVF
jgi:hypothetical protein